MGVFNRKTTQVRGTVTHGVVQLYGRANLTTSGTIVSQTCDGFTVEKTSGEVGRYTIILPGTVKELLSLHVDTIVGDDAAVGTNAGTLAVVRNDCATSAGTVCIQLLDGVRADADATSGAKLLIAMAIKTSGSAP